MVDRGFGLELEDPQKYGELLSTEEFNESNLDWWSEADSADFKLNDKPVTKSGSSRSNKRSRAGIIKPTGSTSADADLQRFAWYFRAYLDEYKFTAGSEDVHTHEFWGGENKKLQSFRAVYVADQLKKYIFGLLCNGLKFEVSDESMNVSMDWIYKTEHAGIIGRNGETFTKPKDLPNDLFVMFYDIFLDLDGKPMKGIGTNLTFEGKNNLAVDKTLGFGSRAPQASALAQKRENTPSVTIGLTEDTIESILKAEYGVVGEFTPGDSGAYEPSRCTILQIPFGITVRMCEYPDLMMRILFPMCTLAVEYDMSGADNIDVTISMETLGSNEITLEDGETKVQTDMYVLLKNNQTELGVGTSPISGGDPETDISVIVEDYNNTPVEGVTVSIAGITGTTGSAGGCTLKNVPVGEQIVSAQKDGYLEYNATETITNKTTSLSIKLRGPTRLKVIGKDSKGKPYAGCYIGSSCSWPFNGTTDEEGVCVIDFEDFIDLSLPDEYGYYLSGTFETPDGKSKLWDYESHGHKINDSLYEIRINEDIK